MHILQRFFFILLIAGLVGIIIFASNKGFDTSDEGFYLHTYQNNFETSGSITLTNKFVDWFLPGSSVDIQDARLLRLGLLLLSAIILAYALHRFLKTIYRFEKTYNLFDLILISMLFYLGTYSIGPLSISYNSMNLVFISLFVAFLIFFYNSILNQKGLVKLVFLSLAGIVLGAAFYVKFTTAMILLVFSLIYLVAVFRLKFSRAISYYFFFCLAFLLSIILFAFIDNDFHSFIAELPSLIMDQKHLQAESVSPYGGLYQIMILGSFFLKLFYYFVSGYAIGYLFGNIISNFEKWQFFKCTKQAKNLIAILLLTIFIVSFLYAEVLDNQAKSIIPLIFILSFFLAIGRNLNFFRNFWTNSLLHDNKTAIVILLLPIPTAVSFGTSVAHISHLLYSIPFFAIIPIVTWNKRPLKILNQYILSIGIVIALFILSNVAMNPYRMNNIFSYNKQIINDKIVIEQNLFTTHEVKDLTRISQILQKHGYERGDYLISAYRMPGMTYLLGGTQPGGMLWGSNDEQSFLKRLNKLDSKVLKNTVLVTRKELSIEFRGLMGEKGIVFPNDYAVYDSLSFGNSEKYSIKIFIPNPETTNPTADN